MSTPASRIQSGIEYQTNPRGRPDENDRSATASVRHDRIARAVEPRPLIEIDPRSMCEPADEVVHAQLVGFARLSEREEILPRPLTVLGNVVVEVATTIGRFEGSFWPPPNTLPPCHASRTYVALPS
jgi:hypothetical protein